MKCSAAVAPPSFFFFRLCLNLVLFVIIVFEVFNADYTQKTCLQDIK